MKRSDIADIKFLLWLIVAGIADDLWLAIAAGLFALYYVCESFYWLYKKD